MQEVGVHRERWWPVGIRVLFGLDLFWLCDGFPANVSGEEIKRNALKRLYCALGMSSEKDCPVDGGWSLWGSWSNCQGECGQVGRRVRYRTCTEPTPAYEGAPCYGDDIEPDSCQLEACSIEQYERLVMGDLLRTGQLYIIQRTHESFPALEKHCLSGDCHYNMVENVLQNDAIEYWNALYCVKRNVGCPAKGGWSLWDPWSPCTALCGNGTRFRQRTCTNPIPSMPQLNCAGPHYDSYNCTGMDCSRNLDGHWSDWKAWSACSKTCGLGVKRRTRDCLKAIKRLASEENINQSLLTALPIITNESVSSTACIKHIARAVTLDSSCSGPSEEVAECENEYCSVNGGWSAWEEWLPCSSLCGVGARSRSRSCSNPVPWGAGEKCAGPVTEVQKCFKRPCSVKTHRVAILDGNGSLLYLATGRPSRLLLLYLRFLPKMSHGMLITRHQENCQGWTCDYVKLALEGRFLVFSIQLSGCQATTISVDKLELGEWHVVLASVAGVAVTLRVDDRPQREVDKFNCVPVLPQLDQPMRVGEHFHGQIQRISINYNPIQLFLGKGSSGFRSGAAPYASTNVKYEIAEEEEGFRNLKGKEMLHIPCPANPEIWQVELTVKLVKVDGLLLLMSIDSHEKYLLLTLETGHVHLRIKYSKQHVHVQSPQEIMPGQWLLVDIALNVSSINFTVNGEIIPVTTLESSLEGICSDKILVGDVPVGVKAQLEASERLRSQGNASGVALQGLMGSLASVQVDGNSINLGKLPAELEGARQLSSYSSSLAEVYEEVPLILGQPLNLECFYGQQAGGSLQVKGTEFLWLHLDKPILSKGSYRLLANEVEFTISTAENITRLKATSYPSRAAIEGFYSCWILPKGLQQGGHILIGYGVTVIQFEIEFNNVPVNAVLLIAATALLACLVVVVIFAVKIKRDRNEKFGLYVQLWQGKPLSSDEEVEHILQQIRSPQGRVILGSEAAVQESEAHLLAVYDEHVQNISDRELPPLPDSKAIRVQDGRGVQEEVIKKKAVVRSETQRKFIQEEYTPYYTYNKMDLVPKPGPIYVIQEESVQEKPRSKRDHFFMMEKRKQNHIRHDNIQDQSYVSQGPMHGNLSHRSYQEAMQPILTTVEPEITNKSFTQNLLQSLPKNQNIVGREGQDRDFQCKCGCEIKHQKIYH